MVYKLYLYYANLKVPFCFYHGLAVAEGRSPVSLTKSFYNTLLRERV